jgi:hypothetical protein
MSDLVSGKFLLINGAISVGTGVYVALRYPDTLFDRVMNGVVVSSCSFMLGLAGYVGINSNVDSNININSNNGNKNNVSYDNNKFWSNEHKIHQQRLEENRISWKNHYTKMDNRSYNFLRK